MLRSQFRSASIVVLLALGVGLIGISCQNRAGDCNETLTCEGSGGNDSTGGGGSDNTGGGTPEGGQGGLGGLGGLGGEGGAMPGSGGAPPCDPGEDECTDDVIVHVSPLGTDDADGSAGAPLQTVAQALTVVTASVEAGDPAPMVYLCATEGAYAETLTLGPEHGSVRIYGGFDCATFASSEERAILVAEEASGHRIEGASGVTLGDLRLESPDAEGNEGASSVALSVVDSTGIRVLRSELVAGEGAPGADGMGYDERAAAGHEGNPGHDACTAVSGVPNLGGPEAQTSCNGSPTVSVGGAGGPAAGAGLPNAGDGGLGEVDGGTAGDGENADVCTNGGNGSQGGSGDHGLSSEEFGTLGAAGYVPPRGASGTPGEVGEGGGGGGGAAKPAGCDTGASGGSGGGGGCPGAGAAGGQGGGGSFAVLAVNSQVELVELSLVIGLGGAGGSGGDGQLGGARGDGALGGEGVSSNDACSGGNGGPGGNGGSGAGGAGGPSIGVAYTGNAPSGLDALTLELPEAGADGGPGGALNVTDGQGPEGVVLESWTP